MAAPDLMARRALGPATLAVVQAVEVVAGGPLLVACSGGPDSLALAAAAAIVGTRSGVGVRAAVVDHGLQAGSAGVASAVKAVLAGLGLEAVVLRVAVEAAGDGVEAAARRARYAALAAEAAPGEVVLLGHTLDDQAETVLLGLARGSGTRSLAGMPARRDVFVRPLLGVRAETTRAACAELGLTAWTDPHNAEPRFTRTRVRDRVLPVLEAELGPGVALALARSAELARADADLLDDLAGAELAANGGEELDCDWLSGLPPALLTRVLRDWLRSHGAVDLSAAAIAGVAALVTDWHGQRWVEVPGVRIGRDAGRLSVRRG
ncbi:MAG TPA: tRNA lysidine(34) synthetase TilS [Propionicimonas sp.]|uniref:tRNA lysidine(34) synthetase TilS n=1 Tax=Propionicimonas sp. TaxID=1955623 RepID=UPI002F3EE91D